ncbi:MAG: type IX secretion system plug protein [Bacteroidia bacterium]
MYRQFIILLFLFFSINGFSQADSEEEDYVNDNVLKYDDYNYKSNIKTVKIHESTWEYASPLINLNSNEQIELSFDDIEGDQKQYSLTFVHCNADWTPSDLMISEYLSGFFDLNFINFTFSMNTLQKYTHYTILFPQQNLKFTKSGNYIVYVYSNGDKKDLVLSRRIMVYDDKVTLASTFRQSTGDEQFNKQHIDFTIYNSGYDITNPYTDLKVVLTQNNRWDNAVTNIKPTFMGGNQFTYSLDDASTFNGGNEFRYFDIRSMKFYTERVKDIYRDENLKNHIVLYPDESRATKPYLFYNDINGSFLIRNRDTQGNQDVEADYVYVDFFLPYPNPESAGNFYIMGKLTDWRMNKKSKLTYNYKKFGYEARLYLKQGYYNYIYVLSNDTKKGGDETVIEGDHWDTENDYCIYVYHRKIGTYYDQLIGCKKINSLKR